MNSSADKYTVTRNACKLCSPLGACLVFKGISGTMSLLHGSQGCSTYIRRYLISHFKEPIDIASSNFSEDTAIFGGSQNLQHSMDNIINQYSPEVIAVASTCLSETIGDDVPMIIRDFIEKYNNDKKLLPEIFNVSTPSYSGSHMQGFNNAVKAAVNSLAQAGEGCDAVNLLPNMISPADIRFLKDICDDFKIKPIVLPDYSDTLDGPLWDEYKRIPQGGTSIGDIKKMGRASATIEFTSAQSDTAGQLLRHRFGVPLYTTGIPIGIRESDRFFSILESLSGERTPQKYSSARGRLIDAMADGHKHLFSIRAAIYGEEDLVVGMASFLSEIGIIPSLCATGERSANFKGAIKKATGELIDSDITILHGVDFMDIGDAVNEIKPDLLLGNSKGYSLARKNDIPLIRIGFPIHDRVGGQRMLHVGYDGALHLFDLITNTIIAHKQDSSSVGYTYM